MEKYDRLDGEMLNPFYHGLRDLVVRLGEQDLEGMITLADVHEHHLSALGTRRVYAGANEDLLAVHVGGEIGDLRAWSALARGGLDQRELAVAILCKVVVELGLSTTGASSQTDGAATRRRRRRTWMAAWRAFSSSASLAARSAFFFSFSASFARFFSSFLLGLCSSLHIMSIAYASSSCYLPLIALNISLVIALSLLLLDFGG